MKLKFDFKWLLISFAIFYFIHNSVIEYIYSRDFRESFLWLFELKFSYLFVSGFIAFFAYALMSYAVLHRYYPSKKYLEIIAGICFFVFPIAVLIRYFLEQVVMKMIFGKGNYFNDPSWAYYFFDNMHYAFLFIGFGTIFFFIQYARHTEVAKKELELQNRVTEMAFLKSQVNPHFLFNVINNIYSLVNKNSPNSLEALGKLSNLLRYSLYEKEEKVSIKKEIAYIDDYIDLQQMRYDFELALQMRLEPKMMNYKIAPFILLPFIENALKHGVLDDTKNPIKIALYEEEEKLHFKVDNKKHRQERDQAGGIGLENVKKRFDLIYQTDSQLQINKNDQNFSIHLEIPLDQC